MICYTVILFFEVGWVAFISILIIILFSFLQYYISGLVFKKKRDKKQFVDSRAKLTGEIMEGIKMIKFDAWEPVVEEKMDKIRKGEKWVNFKVTLFEQLAMGVNLVLPTVLSVVTFTLYSKNGESLSSEQVFSILTVFYCMTAPLEFIVETISLILEASVVSDRFKKIVQLKNHEKMKNSDSIEKGSIEISNGTFTWENREVREIFKDENEDKKEEAEILHDINLKINPGEFLAVIGRVGSGKSSLLNAIMNEIIRVKGQVSKNGSIAYIPQEAFLINETIKENIIFGSEEDNKKFKETVKICELGADLEILPGREFTQIGERGINMSGGQKQRVSIARAVYSDSDIYLIDDALSALDTEVGTKIMKNVFEKKLKDKTRVLVTHKLDLLESVDRIIILKQGEILFDGSYEKAIQTKEFKELDEEERLREIENANHEEENEEEIEIKEKEEKIEKEDLQEKNEAELKNQGNLTKQEDVTEGVINSSVLKFYIGNHGYIPFALISIFFILASLMRLYSDYFVGLWMKDSLSLQNKNIYPLIYIGISLVYLLFIIIRAVLYSFISSGATYKIFKKMFSPLLRRPMRFFDSTPIGQILNRVVSDVTISESMIPVLLGGFLVVFFNLSVVITYSIILSPVMILIVLLSVIVISRTIARFAKVSSGLQRMQRIADAPVISSMGEIVRGASSIRAYDKLKYLVDKFEKRVDASMTSQYHFAIFVPFCRVRVDYSALLIIAVSILMVVLGKQLGYFLLIFLTF